MRGQTDYAPPRVDTLEHGFYDADIRTYVLSWRSRMAGILLLVVWFCIVCLYLVRQQWTGDLASRDA